MNRRMGGQQDITTIDAKTSGDRTMMNVLYAMHAVAPFTLWSASVVALIINYVKRGDEHDALYTAHHDYMISTFWWTMLWLLVSSPLWLLFFVPGATAWFVIGAWYVYRFVRGWLRFDSLRMPS
ncbi:hypothetical protein [Ramlibacter sp.]|uniref:DUF4870 family protein n=1 Tax=Ramlibacter sp. TaxID=1917967 RepID=UPI0025FD594A|nr:hypothetical protein [Ramlibacter sp.]